MGMYHKNRSAGIRFKRFAKRSTSRGMRRAAKKAVILINVISIH